MAAGQNDELFAGLRALAETTFPKRCKTCGRVFENTAAFLRETAGLDHGIRSTLEADGQPIIEVFRNCPCGSTLMGTYSDRRDASAAGLGRRKKFGELMAYLAGQGVDFETARGELLKVLHGEKSALLSKIRPPGK